MNHSIYSVSLKKGKQKHAITCAIHLWCSRVFENALHKKQAVIMVLTLIRWSGIGEICCRSTLRWQFLCQHHYEILPFRYQLQSFSHSRLVSCHIPVGWFVEVIVEEITLRIWFTVSDTVFWCWLSWVTSALNWPWVNSVSKDHHLGFMTKDVIMWHCLGQPRITQCIGTWTCIYPFYRFDYV